MVTSKILTCRTRNPEMVFFIVQFNWAGPYGAFPGQTPLHHILCCSSSLMYPDNSISCIFLELFRCWKPPPNGRNNYLMIMSTYPQTYWQLRIDKVNLPVTSTSTNQRIVHELVTYPVTPLPHLAFKNAFLKPFEDFRVFWTLAMRLLAWLCSKHFSAPNSDV